jgi:aerobic carbon-monoxide dehydrogenase medium subunit
MYPAPFDYQAPQSVNEAISLLTANKDSKLLAGGHSLLPLMKLRLAQPSMLIDIGRIKELGGIRDMGDWIAMGALTTHTQVQWSELVREHCPVLSETASLIGDMQVRNRGTIGGSLAHSDPAADYPAVILALGAEIDAMGPQGKRTIKADDFFVGLMATALNSDELITQVRVPKTTKPGNGAAYEEMPHPASRYAVVGVAVWLMMDGNKVGDVRVGITGATDHAVRASKMENALRGNALDHKLEESASALATDGLTCLGDMFASSDYRAHLVRVYAKRALMKAHRSVDQD